MSPMRVAWLRQEQLTSAIGLHSRINKTPRIRQPDTGRRAR
jgi:hypothetical protein